MWCRLSEEESAGYGKEKRTHTGEINTSHVKRLCQLRRKDHEELRQKENDLQIANEQINDTGKNNH